MKPKQIYVILIALAVFSEFYSISVSADSVVSNSQDVTTPLRILPRMNMEFERDIYLSLPGSLSKLV